MTPTRSSQPKRIQSSSRTFQPVTLSQLKTQLKISQSDASHDGELNRILDLAIQQTEDDTSWAPADAAYSWSPISLGKRNDLPLFNVTAITQVDYIDSDGNQQSVDPARYALDSSRVVPQLVLVSGADWPETDHDAPVPWLVLMRAGPMSMADVPAFFTQTVLSMAASIWTNEDTDDLGRVYTALTNRQHASYP